MDRSFDARKTFVADELVRDIDVLGGCGPGGLLFAEVALAKLHEMLAEAPQGTLRQVFCLWRIWVFESTTALSRDTFQRCVSGSEGDIGRSGGDDLYGSDELRAIWTHGHSSIGDVTSRSAAYVAGYVLKKLQDGPCGYAVVDGNGEVHERTPEFVVMSRRPGIGGGYYQRFGKEVQDHDSVVIDSREVRPPRYYDARHSPLELERIKRKRKRAAVLARGDNTVDRRRVKEKLAYAKLNQKKRSL